MACPLLFTITDEIIIEIAKTTLSGKLIRNILTPYRITDTHSPTRLIFVTLHKHYPKTVLPIILDHKAGHTHEFAYGFN